MTPSDYVLMLIQWTLQYLVRWMLVIMGLFVCAIGVFRTIKTKNKYGKAYSPHSPKYIAQGASGLWEYETFKDKLFLWWTNPEDGLLQEVNGKGSARCGGNERDAIEKYKWAALRNPANYASRELPFFAIDLRDVKQIRYWGDYHIDKYRTNWLQWHLVKTTTDRGWKRYYGLRVQVKGLPLLIVGNKTKPSHIHGDDPDDQQKGTTFRIWALDWLAIIGAVVYYCS